MHPVTQRWWTQARRWEGQPWATAQRSSIPDSPMASLSVLDALAVVACGLCWCGEEAAQAVVAAVCSTNCVPALLQALRHSQNWPALRQLRYGAVLLLGLVASRSPAVLQQLRSGWQGLPELLLELAEVLASGSLRVWCLQCQQPASSWLCHQRHHGHVQLHDRFHCIQASPKLLSRLLSSLDSSLHCPLLWCQLASCTRCILCRSRQRVHYLTSSSASTVFSTGSLQPPGIACIVTMYKPSCMHQ